MAGMKDFFGKAGYWALDIGLSIAGQQWQPRAWHLAQVADALSRRYAPGFEYSLQQIWLSQEVSAPSRPSSYYTTRCS
jgi:hypothetical protein